MSQPKMKTKSKLSYQVIAQSAITAAQRERMFRLLQANYDCVSQAQFEKDLSRKHWIGVLFDETQTLQGFTTFAVNPNGTGTETYNVIFSGDTIVSPEHWGSLAFVRGGIETGGMIAASDPSKTWYWFLISKGHRTFMYLPLFFEKYYPAMQEGEEELQHHLNRMAFQMFGSDWHPDRGLVIFPQSAGQLKPELAEGTWKRRHKSQVAFFLEKNPEFFKGHELACIAELSGENMKGIARECFLEGMKKPLHGPWM